MADFRLGFHGQWQHFKRLGTGKGGRNNSVLISWNLEGGQSVVQCAYITTEGFGPIQCLMPSFPFLDLSLVSLEHKSVWNPPTLSRDLPPTIIPGKIQAGQSDFGCWEDIRANFTGMNL